MNLDRHLIQGLLHEDDLPVGDRIRLVSSVQHEFVPKNRRVFDYVLSHYTEYGKVPDPSTVLAAFPDFEISVNPEPYQFYLREAQKLQQRLHIQKSIASIERGLAAGAIEDAVSEYVLSARNFDSADVKSQDVQLKSGITAEIQDYLTRQTEGIKTGIPTGFSKIDEDTNGIQPGEFWLLAGRPRNYKTWVLCRMAQVAAECAETDRPILFFSKEMTKAQIKQRMMALVGQCSFRDVRRYQLEQEILDRIEDHIQRMFTSEFIIIGRDLRSNYDAGYVQSKILEYRPAVSFVDGLYLMSKDTEWGDHTTLTRSIRDIALMTESAIVGTVQFSKKGLTLDNIAYSDSYAQDASVVIGLERVFDSVQKKLTQTLKLRTLKVRDDESDRMMLVSVGFKHSRFTEGGLDQPDEDDWQSDAFVGGDDDFSSV